MANPAPTIYRIQKKIAPKTLPEILNPQDEKPSGADGNKVQRRLSTKNPKLSLTPRRKAKHIYINKDKKKKKKDSKMEEAISLIINNIGNNAKEIINESKDHKSLHEASKMMINTCMSGWKEDGDLFIHDKIDFKFPKSSWKLNEDRTLSLKKVGKFDYDWLYDIIQQSSIIKEDVEEYDEFDINKMADALSNAASIVKKLNDNTVQEYVVDAARNDNIDINVLKETLKEVGINWKFTGCEIDGVTILINIRVKYSEDGTQKGIIQKDLGIEVKPGLTVTEKGTSNRDSEESEESSKESIDLDQNDVNEFENKLKDELSKMDGEEDGED